MKLPKLKKPDPNILHTYFFPLFWGVKNPDPMTQAIRGWCGEIAPGAHFADNLFTWCRNNSMLEDEAFVQAWQANCENDADRAIVWRRYILACAAFHCVQLEGDFVECGAYTGVGMKTVIDYLGGTSFPRTFWGYDLFEHQDGMLHHAMPGHSRDLVDRVRAKFREYPQVRIVQGNIPEVFHGQSPEKISYLHIDLNQAPAEIAALEALFDLVVPAGMIVLDDYEWSGVYRAQKLAEDPWFEARNYRVFPLPTGQGFVIKR